MSNTAFACPDRAVTEGARGLVGRAVHRHASLSREGVAERLFTLLFSGLVYPQIWEDPVVDLAAMEIEPRHHVVTIASGGCNVLSYLVAKPARITAVDLNRSHVALTKLKLTGIRQLPSHGAFYRFFGEANERANLADYHQHIEPHLDRDTAAFWNGRGLTGRRRIDLFSRNLYRHGMLGKFIGAAHCLCRSYGVNLRGLLAAQSLAEQQMFFDRDIAPLFDKPLVRWITRRPSSLFGLGIPPAQYLELAGAGNGDIAPVLRDRVKRLACSFATQDNYFAWQAFGRQYSPAGGGALPLYLQAQNFSRIRDGAARVDVSRASLTGVLAGMKTSSVDRFVLLDAQDWMGKGQLDALWHEITRTARRHSRVIFRTAGNCSILTGRLDAAILGRWRYEEARSLSHGAADRGNLWGVPSLHAEASDVMTSLERASAAQAPGCSSALVDRIYQRQRHFYDATRKFFLPGRDRLIAELAVAPGNSVLEIGCGTGRNLVAAAGRYRRARFCGLDLSTEMLKTASCAIGRSDFTARICLAHADALTFDPNELFGSQHFDRVFFSYSLSMIPDWRAAINRGWTAVAPGGSLHIVDFGQCEDLPGSFRTLLFAWLARFHVEPREYLHGMLSAAALQWGAKFNFEALHGGYAWYAVLNRMGGRD